MTRKTTFLCAARTSSARTIGPVTNEEMQCFENEKHSLIVKYLTCSENCHLHWGAAGRSARVISVGLSIATLKIGFATINPMPRHPTTIQRNKVLNTQLELSDSKISMTSVTDWRFESSSFF